MIYNVRSVVEYCLCRSMTVLQVLVMAEKLVKGKQSVSVGSSRQFKTESPIWRNSFCPVSQGAVLQSQLQV